MFEWITVCAHASFFHIITAESLCVCARALFCFGGPVGHTETQGDTNTVRRRRLVGVLFLVSWCPVAGCSLTVRRGCSGIGDARVSLGKQWGVQRAVLLFSSSLFPAESDGEGTLHFDERSKM